MAIEAGADVPEVGQIIAPRPNPPPSLDVDAVVAAILEGLKPGPRKALTPTAERQAIVDQHIAGLLADKRSLQIQLDVSVTHLRQDVRWLEERAHALDVELTRLKTSYDFVVAFNWLAFALITLGGGLVGYAAFLPDPSDSAVHWYRSQKFLATVAMTALVIGVVIQGYVSLRGRRAVTTPDRISGVGERPAPNPSSPAAGGVG